jgi:hypothetical protein
MRCKKITIPKNLIRHEGVPTSDTEELIVMDKPIVMLLRKEPESPGVGVGRAKIIVNAEQIVCKTLVRG